MTHPRTCLAPGCSTGTRGNQLFCAEDMRRLPDELRTAIATATGTDLAGAYTAAVKFLTPPQVSIEDTTMTGLHTAHTARLVGTTDGYEHWRVSWMQPERRLVDRNSAITAMMLAEHVGVGARPGGDDGYSLVIMAWAAELNLATQTAYEQCLTEPVTS